ncbi:hypothetical protein NDU88_006380 [Pleurodeles waltl]|uniref:Uncharacterized protein n=1 Tax=Pleurodeles waltl TaxID=8319 RepID=A0AAV7M016_PLEWA|nr:hypothetical protein NDU88_006380 [Pleurodeles waltl]
MGRTQSDKGQTGKPSPSEDNVLTRRSSKEAPVRCVARHSNTEKRQCSEESVAVMPPPPAHTQRHTISGLFGRRATKAKFESCPHLNQLLPFLPQPFHPPASISTQGTGMLFLSAQAERAEQRSPKKNIKIPVFH